MMIGNGSIESGIASLDVSRVDSMAVRHYDFRHKFRHKWREDIAANRLISFGAVKRTLMTRGKMLGNMDYESPVGCWATAGQLRSALKPGALGVYSGKVIDSDNPPAENGVLTSQSEVRSFHKTCLEG